MAYGQNASSCGPLTSTLTLSVTKAIYNVVNRTVNSEATENVYGN